MGRPTALTPSPLAMGLMVTLCEFQIKMNWHVNMLQQLTNTFI